MVTGNVSIHANRIFKITFLFKTPVPPIVTVPIILEDITCVVLTGAPKCEPKAMIRAVEVSAANPWEGDNSSLPIRSPSVRMILQPPSAVPSPMARAHAMTIHGWMTGSE